MIINDSKRILFNVKYDILGFDESRSNIIVSETEILYVLYFLFPI